MSTATFNYESPQFLQDLLGKQQSHLRALGTALDLKTTTRDGWIKLDGSEASIASAKAVLGEVEKLRRDGSEITPALFNLLLKNASSPWTENPAENILSLKLLGTARKPAVLAKTRGQLEYLKAMRDNEVVFGVGPAGTGKTFLAMAQALQALRDKTVQRIVLTRPAVEAGEALGFLPGDLNEKIFPYLRPLYDALFEMMENDEAERLIERKIVEIAPLAYMRGRTLKNSFVILDESQNTTTEQMFMFLTRLGEGSRCVVTGDPSQVDLRRGMRSGLAEAVQILGKVEGIQFVKFDPSDVVRLPVVQRIIEAYREHRGTGESDSAQK
ncbi:PhoH family protein [Phragmitibacter flavus]|uniref:PhoH-like protein n=1 Tax=Phragmitibacter flavus TaxID=2576071 RepID=A0A5R8K881_9BACT|nr:PhoH family protein [Phragmitibacter flavus]TLD68516.1 PhoH family protein [Phragmitibacter flavus]